MTAARRRAAGWLFALLLVAPLPALGAAVTDSTLAARFAAELHALRDELDFPGATAAYVLRDGTAVAVAVGLCDVEAGLPMSERSRMLAASIGKTFVGATAIALAQEGRLGLDDPVARWLGDRAWYRRLPNHASITLRHLLTHSAGLIDHVHTEQFARAAARSWSEPTPLPPEALIEFVLDQAPLFAPGQGWSYSDTGYILAGLVIEAAAGRGYYEEISERFLRPLGLTLTAPADRRELPGLAAGYTRADNPLGLPPRTTDDEGRMRWHPGVEWTGGGLVSNAKDLAVWAKALYEGRAMSGDYLPSLLRAVPVGAAEPGAYYGIGLSIRDDGPFGPSYGHGGWIPGYSSSLQYYPEHGVAIAIQINTDIGLVDDSTGRVEALKTRLARIVMSR